MSRLPTPAALAACLLALGAAGCGAGAAAEGGSGGAHPRQQSLASANLSPATGSQQAGGHRAASPATGAGGSAGHQQEVADPQEAESFPAPASARRRAAATPARAGEVVVAAGAPSDAEVRRELEQMQAAERSAQASSHTFAAVPGGNSIAGSGAIPIPQSVPEVVQKVIAGANEIADFPYVFGGGHGSFVDSAYDCSGSVSYALAAGGLLSVPEASGELEHWGAAGPGRYISVYANAGHAYMYVDGVLYDTAGRSGVYASRWQVGAVDNSGFVVRHWPGL
jgi:hypothetical protein